MRVEARLKQVAIALDQLANAILGGKADETLSARAYRERGNRAWAKKAIDALFFWQEEHCYQSWVAEKDRKQLPRSYRE